jgi:hypothetical protein
MAGRIVFGSVIRLLAPLRHRWRLFALPSFADSLSASIVGMAQARAVFLPVAQREHDDLLNLRLAEMFCYLMLVWSLLFALCGWLRTRIGCWRASGSSRPRRSG